MNLRIRVITSDDAFHSFLPQPDTYNFDSELVIGTDFNATYVGGKMKMSDFMLIALAKQTGLRTNDPAEFAILKKLPVYKLTRYALQSVTFYFDQEARMDNQKQLAVFADSAILAADSGEHTLEKTVHMDYNPLKIAMSTLVAPQSKWYTILEKDTITDRQTFIGLWFRSAHNIQGTFKGMSGTVLGYLNVKLKMHLPVTVMPDDKFIEPSTSQEVSDAAKEALKSLFGI